LKTFRRRMQATANNRARSVTLGVLLVDPHLPAVEASAAKAGYHAFAGESMPNPGVSRSLGTLSSKFTIHDFVTPHQIGFVVYETVHPFKGF